MEMMEVEVSNGGKMRSLQEPGFSSVHAGKFLILKAGIFYGIIVTFSHWSGPTLLYDFASQCISQPSLIQELEAAACRRNASH